MEPSQAQLILIMGLPGSGKTYFAKALAKHLGVLHLNSDRIRKELVAQPKYNPKDKSDVYERMLKRCTDTLIQGETVIVDATFSKAAYREPYLSWAAEHDVPVYIFYLQADEVTTHARVSLKREDSDADYDVYLKIKAEYEPLLQAHRVLRSDEGSTEERINEAISYIHERAVISSIDNESLMNAKLPNDQTAEKLLETHISWVLLCADHVYKIKKPLKLSFLDFSSLAQRKYFVEQELRLNQRLCPQVYLRVLPIYFFEGQFHIGGKEGRLVDYALEMKRLDNGLEMDELLAKGLVTKSDIDRVLKVLIPFHQQAEVIQGSTKIDELITDFTDIAQITDFCKSTLGEAEANKLSESISFVQVYLRAQSALIESRAQEGFVRDVHGDLHAGNIFLTEEPILFDCIEFNPHFRQIDLLNELAFFTMELEFAGHPELSTYLIESYNHVFPIIRNAKEESLYLFYKLYRANVRMKVTAIGLQQSHHDEELLKKLKIFKQYFELYMNYWRLLADTSQVSSSEDLKRK
jgi:aminoglycoside phosphotransferase family enzyme/predicted kinase